MQLCCCFSVLFHYVGFVSMAISDMSRNSGWFSYSFILSDTLLRFHISKLLRRRCLHSIIVLPKSEHTILSRHSDAWLHTHIYMLLSPINLNNFTLVLIKILLILSLNPTVLPFNSTLFKCPLLLPCGCLLSFKNHISVLAFFCHGLLHLAFLYFGEIHFFASQLESWHMP